MSNDNTYLTKVEAAKYLRVATSTVDRWVREGRITRYKIGGTQSVRFKRPELDALLVAETDVATLETK